uniref:Uncharacterized protein n=1 Tax=Cannabis sativa TaxID=3483 RepID=A0A803QX39_CANSA
MMRTEFRNYLMHSFYTSSRFFPPWMPFPQAFFQIVGNACDLLFRMSMVSSNSLNGTFELEIAKYEDYNGDWFINMMNFLMSLNCSWNMVTLHVDRAKALIFPKNLKRMFENWQCTCRFPMLNWEHLRVFTECKGEEESELRDALMWIFPSLKTLSIGERRSC